MVRGITFILIWSVCLGAAFAQRPVVSAPTDSEGIPVFQMETLHIISGFASSRHRRQYEKRLEKFNKLRYNVRKVYPYALAFSKHFTYLHNTLATIEDKQVRNAFKDKVEKDVFGKYEKDLRDMTITQGRILIKLLHREGGRTAYQGIQDLKSGAAAFFWQGVARIFGNNLKSEYDAEEEADIEIILAEIESEQARK